MSERRPAHRVRRALLLIALAAVALAGLGSTGISGHLASKVTNSGNTFQAADDFGSP